MGRKINMRSIKSQSDKQLNRKIDRKIDRYWIEMKISRYLDRWIAKYLDRWIAIYQDRWISRQITIIRYLETNEMYKVFMTYVFTINIS